MRFSTCSAEAITPAGLDYRAVLASIAVEQAGTATARSAASMRSVAADRRSQAAALTAILRPGAIGSDMRALHGSFHPGMASRLPDILPENSVNTPFTLAFEASFNANGVEHSPSAAVPASVR
ncbi:hypothetical protein [Sphingomonas sp. ID0503]|uniref:hypothetical protein n=1 Tax=Sphingomonas sp. ID0503 TaxID=3399691 RepID=UPI003AFAE607